MSRELDALIAEKVMGWKQSGLSNYPWLDGKTLRRNFHPSTSIKDAWEVVERMRKFGYVVDLYLTKYDESYPNEHVVCRMQRTLEDELFSGIAETAPLAICNAALKAIGGEQDSTVAKAPDPGAVPGTSKNINQGENHG